MKKIKAFLKGTDIRETADGALRRKKISRRKTLFAAFMDFTFLPQVLAATWICSVVLYDSVVLIESGLEMALFAVFIEIIVFSVMTAVKRFFLFRFLLTGAYIQLILTALITEFDRPLMLFGTVGINVYRTYSSGAVFGALAAGGILLTAINIIAFYGYKNLRKLEKAETEGET